MVDAACSVADNRIFRRQLVLQKALFSRRLHPGFRDSFHGRNDPARIRAGSDSRVHWILARFVTKGGNDRE